MYVALVGVCVVAGVVVVCVALRKMSVSSLCVVILFVCAPSCV